MGNALLGISIFLLILSLVLLCAILVKNKIINIQQVWILATSGDKLSRIYCWMIFAAFLGAITSVILIRVGF